MSIYRFVNPLELPPITREAALSGAEGVYIVPPGQPREFWREPPIFHDDPDEVGLFPHGGRQKIVYPPLFLASACQARAVGFRRVLTHGGQWFTDQGEFVDRPPAPGRLVDDAGLGFRPEPDGSFELPQRREIHLSGTTVLLTSAEPSNYGSFLFRTLPKLIEPFPSNVRFLIYSNNKTLTFPEFLGLAGVASDRLIQHDVNASYLCDHLLVPSIHNDGAYLDAASLALFARLRDDHGGLPDERMIYVSRHGIPRRPLQNEDELINALTGLGFQIVDPSGLSAAEQIAAFSAASLVVGPSGAGMFNAAFCRPGTKLIDIESEPHWIGSHANLFASCDLRYGFVQGNAIDRDWSQHHKPWRVNIDAVLRRVDEMTAELETNQRMQSPMTQDGITDSPVTSVPDLTGEHYLVFMERLHRVLKPSTYFEIGTNAGASLALSHCRSIAVDPHFMLNGDIVGDKEACLFFQMPSDAFFRRYKPATIFGEPFDLIFLDGMHLAQFLLRDFMNIEKYSHKNSIVMMHDCIPTNIYMAERDPHSEACQKLNSHPGWWSGDVWKTLVALKKYRKDLVISAFDAPPTGLVAVTNLDPKSTILEDKYSEIIREQELANLGEYGLVRYLEDLNILKTSDFINMTDLSTKFWL
jgi:hypothetical protein